MIRKDLRTLIVVTVARRLWLARESRKCPPGSTPLNPTGWFPAEFIPPGTEIPDDELPPPEEPPEEPEPEFPPHEGDELSDGSTEASFDSDEIIEDVVLGGESLLGEVEAEDEIEEDVVEAPPPAPDLINEFALGISTESDQLIEEIILGPPPHVPEILERGLIDSSWETDLISEQVIIFTPTPPDPDLPPPPPQGESWNRILQNITLQGDVVVPAGEKWLIGANVRIQGNLRTTAGTIAMRPGSSLEFIGGDPSRYVGGGMVYQPEFANDFGIWVSDMGELDIRGTPKVGWNRSGVEPTWNMATDEMWIAPTAIGDYNARRWFAGQPIPQVDPTLPAAEIVNVTRDIVIKGSPVAHIHIGRSMKQHRIEFVQLRNMGAQFNNQPILGRYALHFHHCDNGSSGTIIRGVAAIDCDRVYVPHGSHGLTFLDCVTVNSHFEGLWWDKAHETNSVLMDRLGVLGVRRGQGAVLDAGVDNEIKNSFVAGVASSTQSAWVWPEPTPEYDPVLTKLVWKFDTGNVAHNNFELGISFWNNEQAVQTVSHVVADYISYRNGSAGIGNGAYVNCNQYHDCILYEDGIGNWFSDLKHPAVMWGANSGTCEGDRTARLIDSTIRSKDGPALVLGGGAVAPSTYMILENLTLIPGAGQPKVLILTVGNDSQKWQGHFFSCGITPDDVTFRTLPGKNEGTEIFIDHEDSRKWRINIINGQKVVTVL